MRKSKIIKSLIGLSLLITGQSSMAAEYKKLDLYLDNLVKHDKAMLTVAIRKEGKLVYQFAGGVKDKKRQEKTDVKDKFRIGSITKTYTAAVILKLVEQQKLSLTDKLSQYFPDIENSKHITIAQMLKHQSGLFNFTNAPEYLDYMYQEQSHDALLKILSSYSPAFSPGTSQDYSNTNYVLLGFIAEKVTGQALSNLINDLIVKPLGLSATNLSSSDEIGQSEVWSYRHQGDWQSLPNTHLSIPQGAGAIVSNALEVSAFFDSLFSGNVLNNSSFSRMTQVDGDYGLGLMQFPFYERQALGHSGGIDGFMSNASYFPEDKVSVTVLANAVNYNFNDILIAVLSAQFDKPFEIPKLDTKTKELSKDELKAFVGEYSSNTLPLDIRVFLQGNQLMAQASGQGAFELTSFDDNEFRFEQAGITLKFSAAGLEFVLIQGGAKYKYTRN